MWKLWEALFCEKNLKQNKVKSTSLLYTEDHQPISEKVMDPELNPEEHHI